MQLALTVATGPVEILTTSLPSGVKSSSYRATVVAGGGQCPYTWSVAGLPAGLTYTPGPSQTVQITGTPSASGTFTVTVTATDGDGSSAKRSLQLSVFSSG